MIFTGTAINEDVKSSTNSIIKVLQDMEVVWTYKQQDQFKEKMNASAQKSKDLEYQDVLRFKQVLRQGVGFKKLMHQ